MTPPETNLPPIAKLNRAAIRRQLRTIAAERRAAAIRLTRRKGTSFAAG